jgi:glycosyltransferase involved in cell wall biosynthesis
MVKLALTVACTLRLLVRLPGLRAFDAVIIHREVFPLGWPPLDVLVTRLHPRVFLDLDDAIWHAPSNPVHQRKLFFDPRRHEKVMRGCVCVVAGNAYLAACATPHAPRVEVVPTTYDDLGGPAPGRPEAPVRLVWIGNWGNAHYLETILPALDRLATDHDIRLRVIGGPDVFDLRAESIALERLPWQAGMEGVWLRESHIGIMPLPDLDYERGKCGFKLVQYYSAGLPVVASPVGMNVELVRDGENGFLARTPEEWEAALARLIADPDLRQRLGQRGRAAFQRGFVREVAVRSWVSLLRPGPIRA